MYRVYAELSHRPIVLMSESGTPFLAAAVAAPIRKLWPLYVEASTPCNRNAAHTYETNRSRING